MGQEVGLPLVRLYSFSSLPAIYSLSKHISWAQSQGRIYGKYEKATFISKDSSLPADGLINIACHFGYDNQEP